MGRLILVFLNSITLALAFSIYAFSDFGSGDGLNGLETLFKPADYAFSIWGFIFLMLILFAIFQWIILLKKNGRDLIGRIHVLFMLSNLLLTGWMIYWNRAVTGLSVLVMILLMITLIILVVRLRMEIWDAPVRIIAFVWWPLAIYFGWMIMETLTRIAAYFSSFEWVFLQDHQLHWTFFLLFCTTVIYLLIIFTRNLREAALAGIWGLTAIAVRHGGSGISITLAAAICAAILLVAVSYHGYRNRSTSPISKLRRGEI